MEKSVKRNAERTRAQILDAALKEFDESAVTRIRATKLKYDVDFHHGKPGDLLSVPPGEVIAQQLIEAAVAHDESLIGLYNGILKPDLGQEATELIESLIRVEERDIVMLKKMLAMNYF